MMLMIFYLSKFVAQPRHLLHEVHLVPILDLLQLGLVQLNEEAEEVGRVTAGVQELLAPAGAKKPVLSTVQLYTLMSHLVVTRAL